MSYKNGNYCAFYVAEPFSESNLSASATKDFCHYNLLKAWKAKDSTLNFINSHDKTYNVRDNSDWESTLKPRLHERLNNSKNIILFLSTVTKNSRALREEIDFGINNLALPVIVIYPDYNTKESLLDGGGNIRQEIKHLWDALPVFRDSAGKVPVLHIPFSQSIVKSALSNNDFMLNSKTKPNHYWYKV